MNLPLQKVLRRSGLLLLLVIAILALVAGWFYRQMQHNLPQLDGAAKLAGLSSQVTVERDALGIPTVKGNTRLDVALALGWLHAQDRFFQMDLMRRKAAGELAALFGTKAVPADKEARTYGFRRLAKETIANLSPAEHALIEAYTTGVNAGLQSLAGKPSEYIFLRADPKPWMAEDTVLVAFAMAMELSDKGNYERSLSVVRLVFGGDATAFFAPLLTTDDVALDRTAPIIKPSIPSARVIDFRLSKPTPVNISDSPAEISQGGSNSFALSGAHTASGATMLANDMHLQLGVPNTWYRASLEWPVEANTHNQKVYPEHKVTGVTLPGVPLVIAGSNGHVAWGLTNAYADTSDIIVIEPSVIARSLYKNKYQLVPFEQRHEIIEIKGEAPLDYVVTWTEWGPVIGTGDKTRPLVLHWTAQADKAINLSLVEMETAISTAEAIRVAHRAGMPAQNILIVDDQGHTAWTITGGVPKREGYDGRFPVSWTYGDRYWSGMVVDDNIPVIADPESGRLWTANHRIVGGTHLDILGDGGYDRPHRAARIRDRLNEVEDATPADLLSIQLDDKAPMLDRWHQLLLDTLTPEVMAGNKSRSQLREELENWDARARIDSVSYRLVKQFRTQTARLVFDPIFAPCVKQFKEFSWRRFQYEQPLWTLVTVRPIHMLNPRFDSWPELLIAAADKVVSQMSDRGLDLDEATWGQRNRAQIQHPLARALPNWLSGWLNMPDDPLPGDNITPRVQRPHFGASERFVVSPGRESEGLFHMPGGQSGHPLSPFYRAGHEAWVRGDPTPFLPGETIHSLTLTP